MHGSINHRYHSRQLWSFLCNVTFFLQITIYNIVMLYICIASLWASLVAQLVQNLPAMHETQSDSWVRRIPWRRELLSIFLGFHGGSDSKESTCNAGVLCSIPRLGRSPGRGHSNSLQYSCLENPHGQRSLAGYSPWGHKQSDMTEQLNIAQPSPASLHV